MPVPQLDPATRALFYRYDRDLPLQPRVEALSESDSLTVQRFEVTSRHDQRVPGLLLSDPRANGPRPTVLIAHPATLDKSNDYVLMPARRWVAQGATCVTIDQAGHGERQRPAVGLEQFSRYPVRQADETVQTAVDWMRVLDFLEGRPEVDALRIAFVGFSMGAGRGAPFVGLDDRVRAAAFCISGAAPEPSDDGSDAAHELAVSRAVTDPLHFAPLIAPRSVLLVAGLHDDVMPPQRAQAFYDALGEPRELVWLPCGHWDFWPQGLDPIWPFLAKHL